MSFTSYTDEEKLNIKERLGHIAPRKDNLVVEGSQGVMHGLSTVGQGFASAIDGWSYREK